MSSRLGIPDSYLSKALFLVTFSVIFLGFFAVPGSSETDPESEVGRVVLLSIDGARPDYVRMADTPTLDMLGERGATALHSYVDGPRTSTPPQHASMLTGAFVETHGYPDERGDPEAETVIEVFEGEDKRTAFIDGKAGRIENLERGANIVRGDKEYEDDHEIARDAKGILAEKDPWLLFALLPDVDYHGHRYGHRSDEYLNAIERADEAIGKLVEWAKEDGSFEDTLWVIGADHGMTDYSHVGYRPGDWIIPTIFSGPEVPESSKVTTGRIIDIAPTISRLTSTRKPGEADGEPLDFRDIEVIEIRSPEEDEMVTDPYSYPTFEWEEVGDAAHRLSIDDEVFFDDPVVEETDPDSGTYTAELEGGEYLWRVEAYDDEGELIAKSPVSKVTVHPVRRPPVKALIGFGVIILGGIGALLPKLGDRTRRKEVQGSGRDDEGEPDE